MIETWIRSQFAAFLPQISQFGVRAGLCISLGLSSTACDLTTSYIEGDYATGVTVVPLNSSISVDKVKLAAGDQAQVVVTLRDQYFQPFILASTQVSLVTSGDPSQAAVSDLVAQGDGRYIGTVQLLEPGISVTLSASIIDRGTSSSVSNQSSGSTSGDFQNFLTGSSTNTSPAVITTYPAAPQNLTGTASTSKIDLSWSPVKGNTKATYNIYRKVGSESSFTVIASGITTTSFSNTGLTAGTNYTYQVTANNSAGESVASSPAQVRPIGNFAISSVTVNGPSALTVAWPAVTGADTYTLKYGTSSGNYSPPIPNATSPATIPSLTPGTTYFFMVTASNSVGAGTSLNANSEMTGVPLGSFAISSVTQPTSGQALVSFSASAGATSNSYIVKYGTTSGSYTTTFPSAASSPITVTGLTNGTTYYFKVYAVNASGQLASSEVTEATLTPNAAPRAPINPTATASPTSVVLNWAAGSESGSISYDVYRSTTSGSGYAKINLSAINAPTRTYTDNSVSPGVSYYYVVTATNTGGTSSNSTEAAARPIGNFAISSVTVDGPSALKVTWPAVTGADTYTLKYGTSSGNYSTPIPNATSPATIPSLTPGTTYFVMVTANNSVGAGTSLNANSEITGAPLGAFAISSVTQPTSGQAQVNFGASTGATSNSYIVKYGTTSGSYTTTFPSTASPPSATISGLTNGTTYYFKVYAVNGSGQLASSESTEAQLTPKAPPTAPTGLTVTSVASQAIALSWSAPVGSFGPLTYNLLRGTSSGGETSYQTRITGTTTTDTGAVNGTTYYYKVQAVGDGGTSPSSGGVSATPYATPNAPTSLVATAGNASVSLSWTDSLNSGASYGTVTYTILRGTSSGSVSQIKTGVTTTSWVDNSTNNTTSPPALGQIYYYQVKADGPISSSATNSNEASATPFGAATQLAFTTSPASTGTAGTALSTQPVIAAKYANGNTANTYTNSITFTGYSDASCTTAVSSSLSGNVVSAVAGVATFSTLTPLKTSVVAIKASDGTLATSCAAVTVAAGAPATMTSQGNNQSGSTSTQLTNALIVTVTDANSNPVSGSTINWAVTAGGGSFSSPTSTTGTNGQASNTWTLGSAAGSQTATATVNGYSSITQSFTATAIVPGVPGSICIPTNTPFGSGSGVASDPYLICSAAHLAMVANASYVTGGKFFKLASSIDLTGNSTFAPIGTSTTPFVGTFDGDGYTISNWTYNQSASSYLGLFGATGAGAVIRNVNLKNFAITGANNIGSLIGRATTTTIQNCSASAISLTSSSGSTGGLIGYLSTNGSITSSSSTGTLSGAGGGNNGGLVGYSYLNNSISKSFSNVTITGTGSSLGGLVGYEQGGTVTITNSYASGNITGSQNLGGIIGGAGGGGASMSYSYYSGRINSNGNGYSGPLAGLGNVSSTTLFWDSSVANVNSAWTQGVGYPTATMKAAAPVSGGVYDGWDTLIWKFTAGSYPTLIGVPGTGAPTSLTAVSLKNAVSLTWVVPTGNSDRDNLKYNVLRGTSSGAATLYASNITQPSYTDTGANSGVTYFYQVQAVNSFGTSASSTEVSATPTTGGCDPNASPFGSGSGSSGDPWMICSPAQLAQVNTNFSGSASFKLASNIDLTSASTFSPIGSSTTPFLGTFDGNYYTLSNWTYINVTTDYIGLFAALGASSTVKNLKLSNFNIAGKSYVGGLVGDTPNGSVTITNCSVTGSVISGRPVGNVGGLAGRIYKNSSVTSSAAISILITPNAFSAGGGFSNVGGLVGTLDSSTITQSYSSGYVTVGTLDNLNYIGGLVGNSNASLSQSIVSKSYSSANVTTNQSGFTAGVGGLIGNSNQSGTAISDSYATGNLIGGWVVGGILGPNSYNNTTVLTRCYFAGTAAGLSTGGLVAGDSWGTLTVNNSFWNTTIGPANTVGNKGTGKTTAQMQTAATFAGWSSTTWSMVDGSYPTLINVGPSF